MHGVSIIGYKQEAPPEPDTFLNAYYYKQGAPMELNTFLNAWAINRGSSGAGYILECILL